MSFDGCCYVNKMTNLYMITWMIMVVHYTEVASTSIITPPRNTTGELGQTAEFECEVEFGPNKNLYWKFSGVIIYTLQGEVEDYPAGRTKYSVKQDQRHFKLTVNNLQCNDSGTFTCEVPSGDKWANLVVIGTPQISSPLNPVNGSTGQYACTALFGVPSKEEPRPKLQMFFDGGPVNGAVEEQEPAGSSKCYNLTQTYSVKLETSMNGKELVCDIRTSSPLMHLEVTQEVTVLYAAHNISYTPKKEQYEVGEKITCRADGNPEPMIEWRDIGNTGNAIHGKPLEITKEMIGQNTWQCIASNNVSGNLDQTDIEVPFEAVMVGGKQPESSKDWIAGVVVPIVIAIVCTVIALWYLKRKRKEGPRGSTEPNDRLPVGDLGQGLAWAYYDNYFKVVGPDIDKRIAKGIEKSVMDQGMLKQLAKKLFIVLPSSCRCFARFEDTDPAIKNVDVTEKLDTSTRPYENPIHKFQVEEQTYFACMEYCTPVRAMYEMCINGVADLSESEKRAQLHIFYELLNKVMVEHPYETEDEIKEEKCRDIKLVPYNDAGREKLSVILAEQIQNYL